MRICVVGAGAIGGLLAARLARAGHQVSVILRGANLAAVRERGLRLIEPDGSSFTETSIHATSALAEAGVQDLVILALKAHQVADVAAGIPALLGPETRIVTMQNGIPWWYFHKLAGPYQGRALRSVDPTGEAARHIDADRVIGSVVYPASEIIEPGVVRLIEGNKFSLGELDGADSPSLRAVAEAFKGAGFRTPISRDIRADIWLKLWGNLSFNPISALTHATLEDICRFDPTRSLVAGMMGEAQAICVKLGAQVKVDIAQRIAGAQAVGAHKTSMLQDVEAGRPLELDALVGSVLELGEITETATPTVRAVHALVSLLAQQLARHPGGLRLA